MSQDSHGSDKENQSEPCEIVRHALGAIEISADDTDGEEERRRLAMIKYEIERVASKSGLSVQPDVPFPVDQPETELAKDIQDMAGPLMHVAREEAAVELLKIESDTRGWSASLAKVNITGKIGDYLKSIGTLVSKKFKGKGAIRLKIGKVFDFSVEGEGSIED